MVSLWEILWAGIVLGVLLLMGELLVRCCGPLRKIYLPASIIAGTLALLCGPQVLGEVLASDWAAALVENLRSLFGEDIYALVFNDSAGLFSFDMVAVWGGIPGILINVVFAALLMGKPVPGLGRIWRQAGPQVCFGQSLAWGQYVVGILLVVLVLHPLYEIPYVAGALIEIGFEGGHGTAAGMGAAFAEVGWPEGEALALGLATIGLVGGVVLGTILINWAVRRGTINPGAAAISLKEVSLHDSRMSEGEWSEIQREREEESKPTDPLSLHLGLVGLAIAIGWMILEGFRKLEILTWGAGEDAVRVFTHVPLFPLAMIGGVLIQILFDKLGKSHLISERRMNRISGAALDFTIVAALGALSLEAIGENLMPFFLLALTGIVWSLFAVLVIAPRIIPESWFERGVGDFGQSMGVTVTGLLLMRVADPTNKSGALQSFGYKQMMFEPIVGGGLFTGASVALIFAFGPMVMLGVTSFALLFWLALGFIIFGKAAKQNRAVEKLDS